MALEGRLDVTAAADAVEFSLTVENAGDAPVTLQFRSAKKADFAVLDGDDEVWRWSEGRMFAQMLQSDDHAPGDSRTFEATWEDPESGEFVVVGTLESDPGLEVRESFSV